MPRDVADHPSKPDSKSSSLGLSEPQAAKPGPAGRHHRRAASHAAALPITREELPQLVDARTAAQILGKSVDTLKRWRYEGIGPDYVVIEGRVSYDVRVLVEYVRQRVRVPSVRAQMEDSREAL